jgi:DeoR/GlpR family transcriptional regulator of sugar metabolism
MRPTEERFQAILRLVAARDRVSIAELSRQLKVSEMTIRRDLASLDAEGALRRVRGGAVPAASGSYEPPFAARAKLNTGAKRDIAIAVAGLVSDGETVILDGGTTGAAIAEELLGRDITVCTPSLRVADVLSGSPTVRVMIPGGIVRPDERTLIGPPALRIFEDHRFDVYLMTVSGIHVTAGLTEWNLDDAAVKRAALGAACRCVVACDATKFGKTAFGRICPVERADVIVTDESIAAGQRTAFTATGVELRVA